MPRTVTVFRFAPDPSIVVLDFASLREQGLMLNRVAALVEKAAAPRDRVLNDAQLGALIRASGDTVETYYYGHDYSAAELARFFRLAEAQHVQLYPEEVALHKLLVELGWLQPGVNAALITVPKQGANPEVTAAARATILRHELSHGEYFSNPAYQAYVHRFWEYSLTDTERHAVRDYLTSEEYDAKIESLLESEMQAYLMFTPDPAFFAPSKIGMTPEHLRQLQRQFYFGMPNGWLRNVLGETLAKANAAAR